MSTRRPCSFSPTESEMRPASSASEIGSDELPTPSAQRLHIRLLLAKSCGGDDRLQVGSCGQQLVGQPGLSSPGAHQRLGQGDQREVLGSGRGWSRRLLDRFLGPLAGTSDGIQELLCAAALSAPADAADLAQVFA